MKRVRLCLLPFALFTLSNLGCNGGDLGPGTQVTADATEEDMAGMDMAAPGDATEEEDMAGMDMAVPHDTEAAETAAEVGPTATDASEVEDMAGMDMNAHETTTAPDTSMAGMEM